MKIVIACHLLSSLMFVNQNVFLLQSMIFVFFRLFNEYFIDFDTPKKLNDVDFQTVEFKDF